MKRSLVAGGIAAVVAVSTGAGWLAASRVKSPAQLAAEAAPPEASLVTYAVEKRVLSSDLIIRGTMRYSDPITVVLAPSALRPPPVLVSTPPVKGATLEEGDVAMVVSGRPVFAIVGSTPGYRDLGPGLNGADVRQLEEYLERAGFGPGPIDGVFDAGTASAVTTWYLKAGYEPYGPNDQQRAALRLAQTAVSQATDRLLQAKQAELLNRSGAKPADTIDAKAAVEAAQATVENAQNASLRDSSRGLADLAIKEAELLSKSADIGTREAAVLSATVTFDDARRRDGLTSSGLNVATGVILTPQQLSLLEDAVAEARSAVAAAEVDLRSSEAIAASVRSAGDAAVADARAKFSAVSVFVVDGLSPQQLLDANAAVRVAQTAVSLADATANREYSVAAADMTAKRNLLETAKVRVTQAQRRMETAKSGVDPATGLPVASSGDQATSQLAVKQAELSLRQAEIALAPARAVLLAAQSDVAAVRRSNELTASANRRAVTEARSRLSSAQARLRALSLPGVGAKTLSEAVDIAQSEVTRLADELQKTAATIGVQVPANEVVFFPALPLRIDDTKVKRGDPATAEVMTVSGTRLAVDSSLLTTEAPLTKLDAVATIEAPEFGYASAGRITFIADKPGLRGTDAQHIAIEVTPDDNAVQLVGASVRITIPTRTTNGKALVVPISALSVRADGSTQLQIEDTPGNTRTVIVTAGLSAQGFVEIIPVQGMVSEGDRVVIGTNGASSAPDLPAPDLPAPTGSSGSATTVVDALDFQDGSNVGGKADADTPTTVADSLDFHNGSRFGDGT